ncbi:MAG: alpha/beta hydrolase, partial [Cyanobacteria bacterium P01_H01_bin.119]
RALSIPPDSQLSWSDLTTTVAELVMTECSDREIYICGESFGGCLALRLASQYPHLAQRLIVVNCASAFRRRLWLEWGNNLVKLLAVPLFQVATYGLLPFLAGGDRVDEPERQALVAAMQAVTPSSASWRIRLLMEFDLAQVGLNHLVIPTLLIASQRDRLLPSGEEARRLQRHISQAQILDLPVSGHTCLLEKPINLSALLRQVEFLPSKRVEVSAYSR